MAIEVIRMLEDSSTKDTKIHQGKDKLPYWPLRAVLCSLWIVFFFLLNAPWVSAQSPAPTPAGSEGVANADALTSLVIAAGNLIPRVQEAVESPLVQGLENLAFWIAVVVMMFSFARLFRENDGATKDLFWWCFQLAIVFTLFGTGRAIINTWGEIGYDIVNVTQFRKVLWDAELEFNTSYEKFT